MDGHLRAHALRRRWPARAALHALVTSRRPEGSCVRWIARRTRDAPDRASLRDGRIRAVASSTERPAIVVRRLEKRYGDVHAVRGIDFEVASGEVFGFLGPNGA